MQEEIKPMPKEIKRTLRAYMIYQVASQGIFDRGIFILFLASKGFTSNEIGALQSILFMVSFLAEVPTGIWGDKYGRKKSVFLGLLIYIAYCFGVISISGFIAFALLYTSYGVAMAFVSGSDRALVYDYLKDSGYEKQFIAVESKAQGMGAFFLGLAIVAGGYLQNISWDAVYIAYAVSLMVALAAWTTMHDGDVKAEASDDSDSSVLREAYDFFHKKKGRKILPLIFAYAFLSASIVPFFVFSQSILETRGFTIELVAWVFAIAQISSSMGYFITERISKIFSIRSLFGLMPIGVFAVLATNIHQSVVVAVISLFFVTMIMPVIEIIFMNYVNAKMDSRTRASANSFISFVESCLISIGYLALGYFIEWFGQPIAIVSIGSVALIAIPLAIWYFRNRDQILS